METDSATAAVVNDTDLSELELLRLENERLKTEVQAHHKKDQDLKALAEDIENRTKLWESLKNETKEANEKRIIALEALADLAAGHVQTEIFNEDGNEEVIDFRSGINKKRPQTLSAGTDHMKVCGTFRAFQFALTVQDLNKCDASNLIQIEPEVGKRKVGAVKALEGLYVCAYQHIYEDGSGYFNAWPLLDPGDWDQRLAETYGSAVFDLGDDKEADEKRKAGGEFCGIVVKHGRRKYVVGPDAEAVRLIYGTDGMYAQDTCIAAQLMGEVKA